MQITNIEEGKDKNGNLMKILTVGDNKIFVNSKYDPETYQAVQNGMNVEIEKDGNFWRIMRQSLGLPPKQATQGRTGGIAAAQENKAKQIAHAQENSSLNVKIASTFRDATLLTTARMAKTESQVPLNVVQEEWNKWRGWLWARYDDPKEPEWIENMTNPF